MEDEVLTCPQTLWLSNLPREEYPSQGGYSKLTRQCLEFGLVEYVHLLDGGDSLSAVVRFRGPHAASSALKYFQDFLFKPYPKTEVRRGRLPPTYKKQTTLYMSNLPVELSDQQLADLAGQYGGRVRALKVLSRRADCGARALIDMATPEEAQTVVHNLTRTPMGPNVRLSDRKLLTDHSVTYVVTRRASPPQPMTTYNLQPQPSPLSPIQHLQPPPPLPIMPIAPLPQCMCCSPFSPIMSPPQCPKTATYSAFMFPPPSQVCYPPAPTTTTMNY